jgi:amidohydrolase
MDTDPNGPVEGAGGDRGAERRERGKVAGVVAPECRDREPVDECARRVALVDLHRRAELNRHAGAELGQPEAARDVARDVLHLVGPLRRRAPVQRHRDPGLRLDEVGRQSAQQLVGRVGDSVEIRDDTCVDGSLAVVQLLHPVQPRERESGHRQVRGEELGGPAADDRDPPEHRHEPCELDNCRGQRARIFRSLDDRRERAVEIGEQRGARGPFGERGDRCVGVEHGATLAGMETKETARATVDAARDTLIDLSHRIHSHPELKFEEVQSSAWTAGVLADAGLPLDMGICELPTAFASVIGDGPLHLAICAEYDALPGIGHACGHNIIASAAVGAALALAPLVDDLGITLHLVGTPAEEGGGGKVYLLERGAFDGVHAAMMVHPAPIEDLYVRVTAVAHMHVEYTGKPAHAAFAPHAGINAGDAMTVAQVGLALLRQHLPPGDQLHGVVLHAGEAANVVPAHADGLWMARAPDLDALDALRPRVLRCFEAGALATGASLRVEDVSPDYAQMEHDHEIGELFRANARALGRPESQDEAVTFSTDMGNVSLAMPAIHPCLAIETGGAVNHQPEFAAAAVNASADRAVLEGALGMAWTAIDVATGPLRERLLTR